MTEHFIKERDPLTISYRIAGENIGGQLIRWLTVQCCPINLLDTEEFKEGRDTFADSVLLGKWSRLDGVSDAYRENSRKLLGDKEAIIFPFEITLLRWTRCRVTLYTRDTPVGVVSASYLEIQRGVNDPAEVFDSVFNRIVRYHLNLNVISSKGIYGIAMTTDPAEYNRWCDDINTMIQ